MWNEIAPHDKTIPVIHKYSFGKDIEKVSADSLRFSKRFGPLVSLQTLELVMIM